VVKEDEAELEQRLAADRVARWFGRELSTLLSLLRETVQSAQATPVAGADARAAASVQTAARACSAEVSTLLALRSEPPLAGTASPKAELLNLLRETPGLRGRDLSAEGLEGELPLPAAVLRTVLREIVQNALDASPEAPRLETKLGPQRELWVKSASQMSREEAKLSVFPFYTTKPGHPGLGLSLAHVAAQNQGGTLCIVPDAHETRVGLVFPEPAALVQDSDTDGSLSFACRLSARLAHDVNNALMAALGWAEILGDARDDAERTEALSTLSQAADYLEAMSYLLPYKSAASPGGAQVDVGSAIDRMRPLLRAVLEHKADRKIALRVEPVQGARATMSEDALRSVVLRLAESARDAMPRGGTWTISCDVTPHDLMLRLSTDARPSDPMEETRRRGAGPGDVALGLAVVRDLVSASGGTLDLDPRDEGRPARPGARIRLPLPPKR